ncbi:hypothetical protein [aff. Roholtiella sp. LEGE 12411]|uniref:hypothetical protein n=1 Tax=aff. Roholtiella sp. LEGE 12411 TaxID=1828822 RepID=UPI00187F2253|nr:hypothetical protein [aff. Roholtiella sp. LEGE 12411]
MLKAIGHNEKLHAQGHGAWGMGHGKEATNALCPKRRGAISLHIPGDGVSRRFQ